MIEIKYDFFQKNQFMYTICEKNSYTQDMFSFPYDAAATSMIHYS
jgi:hypothetical protein